MHGCSANRVVQNGLPVFCQVSKLPTASGTAGTESQSHAELRFPRITSRRIPSAANGSPGRSGRLPPQRAVQRSPVPPPRTLTHPALRGQFMMQNARVWSARVRCIEYLVYVTLFALQGISLGDIDPLASNDFSRPVRTPCGASTPFNYGHRSGSHSSPSDVGNAAEP